MCLEQPLSPLQLTVCTWYMVLERGTMWQRQRCCTTNTSHAQSPLNSWQSVGGIPCSTCWKPVGSSCILPASAQDSPLQPRATPRLTSHPRQTRPASSQHTTGGCRRLFLSALWRKNTEKNLQNELQRIIQDLRLLNLSLLTLSKRQSSTKSISKRHFWGETALKIKVKSIKRHRGLQTKQNQTRNRHSY